MQSRCSLPVQDTFANCPPLDIVLMGAHVEVDNYAPSEAELNFIRKSYDDCSAFITICGGFLGPMQAGLFKGKTVTAPRFMLEQFRSSAPETKWVEERWHRDGKLWTSGALLNGLDLMRAFGTEYWGGEGSMMQFALNSGHYPQRDVGYADAPSKF
jgi:transcriptional regulator GlxA family with amidase domain